jgi:hypothetical protein
VKKHKPISYDRVMQVINNCAEEFVDLGQTNFATKAELCQAILFCREEAAMQLRRKDEALDDALTAAARVSLIVMRGRLYPESAEGKRPLRGDAMKVLAAEVAKSYAALPDHEKKRKP